MEHAGMDMAIGRLISVMSAHDNTTMGSKGSASSKMLEIRNSYGDLI